jgi:hypothetical protein
MPVLKCNNGKYRIGQGACIYETEEKATKVYQAILAGGKFAEESYTDYPESAVINAKRALNYAKKNGWGL